MDLKSINIVKEKNYHQWVFEDNFEHLNVYKIFLNWTSGEFTLCLQDYVNDELIIYFPNGWFSIKMSDSNDKIVHFKIEVKSKCLKKGSQIFSEVKSILTHIKTFKIKVNE